MGITANGAQFSTGGLDGAGNAYSANVLGTSQTVNGVGYHIAPAGANNVIEAVGQTIGLPIVRPYSQVDLLATGVNGNQPNQTFTVNYTERHFADLYPKHQRLAYARRDMRASRRRFGLLPQHPMGGGQDNKGPFDVYGYSFALDHSLALTLRASRCRTTNTCKSWRSRVG